MNKIRVKFLESIAGMADPKPKSMLDEKYVAIRRAEAAKEKPRNKATIDSLIETMKKQDRYGDPALGFPREWSFRPNEEALISADLAEKWEAAGTCIVLSDVGEGRKSV